MWKSSLKLFFTYFSIIVVIVFVSFHVNSYFFNERIYIEIQGEHIFDEKFHQKYSDTGVDYFRETNEVLKKKNMKMMVVNRFSYFKIKLETKVKNIRVMHDLTKEESIKKNDLNNVNAIVDTL